MMRAVSALDARALALLLHPFLHVADDALHLAFGLVDQTLDLRSAVMGGFAILFLHLTLGFIPFAGNLLLVHSNLHLMDSTLAPKFPPYLRYRKALLSFNWGKSIHSGRTNVS